MTANDARTGDGSKLTIADIETQLRSLGDAAGERLAQSRNAGITAASAGAVLLLAATYLHGRRRGRKRATVLEIRRI